MASSTQRQISIEVDLGADLVRPLRVDAHEGLSQAFHVSLDVTSDFEVDFKPHLGKPVSIDAGLDGAHQRYFHGVLASTCSIDMPLDGYTYRLTLVPATYFLEHGRNFRIFQDDMTVIEIVKQVLTQDGIEFDTRIGATLPTRKYCVQYGESDFAFVCRLFEQYGLYYFYRHEKTRHVLVICDSKSSHDKLKDGSLSWNPASAYAANADSSTRGLATEGKYVTDWREYLSSGAEARVTLRDFDFQHPASPVESIANHANEHAGAEIEVYGWPGKYYEKPQGNSLAEYQLEARRALRLRYEGVSHDTAIQAGFLMTLKDHKATRFNRDYLIVMVHTALAAETYSSGEEADGTLVQFTAIPDDTQFRAPIVTPIPVARGPETAVVTGPSGEEIYTDKYGRIKVQFHWDREGKLDDHSSCWIRVSQTGGLGNNILPRIGHEVLVDFINGDPDRPIVTGRVFNEDHMPVYPLPDNKTRALWRTKTYKRDQGDSLPDSEKLDTGAPGANELRFEDMTGKEELFVHAERDMKVRVRHKETHHVGQDSEIKIGKNRKKDVGVDETMTVKGKQDETVTGNRTVTVKSSDKLDVTQKIDITAGQEINIKVGASTIKMTTSSIEIKSPMIKVEASGQLSAKGAMTNVEASGIMVIKGSLVNIN